MRISDWSSDVCSSDLLYTFRITAARGTTRFPPITTTPPGGHPIIASRIVAGLSPFLRFRCGERGGIAYRFDVCCRQLAARIPGRAPALSPSEYCPSTIGYRASATTSFPHGSTADQRSPGKALIRAASDTRRGPVSLRISVSLVWKEIGRAHV